jgi:SAM-dependent methyltransferase
MRSIKMLLKKLVPGKLWRPLARLADRLVPRRVMYFGRSHYCPICRSRLRRFRDFSPAYRNAECPVCELHPRHRLLWLYFTDRLRLFETGRLSLLHFAPEKPFAEAFLRAPGIQYTSADLCSPAAMVKVDICKIPYPDAFFDAILCSHVLEHVSDDRAAMRELFRVLKPGGWAILQVPIDESREHTLEDPAIRTPEDREKFYRQYDHVRLYGRDYAERLRLVGFEVEIDWYVRTFSPDEVQRFGLDPAEGIYRCTKPGVVVAGPCEADAEAQTPATERRELTRADRRGVPADPVLR